MECAMRCGTALAISTKTIVICIRVNRLDDATANATANAMATRLARNALKVAAVMAGMANTVGATTTNRMVSDSATAGSRVVMADVIPATKALAVALRIAKNAARALKITADSIIAPARSDRAGLDLARSDPARRTSAIVISILENKISRIRAAGSITAPTWTDPAAKVLDAGNLAAPMVSAPVLARTDGLWKTFAAVSLMDRGADLATSAPPDPNAKALVPRTFNIAASAKIAPAIFAAPVSFAAPVNLVALASIAGSGNASSIMAVPAPNMRCRVRRKKNRSAHLKHGTSMGLAPMAIRHPPIRAGFTGRRSGIVPPRASPRNIDNFLRFPL